MARPIPSTALLTAMALLAFGEAPAAEKAEKVVIPFDFVSKFDEGVPWVSLTLKSLPD